MTETLSRIASEVESEMDSMRLQIQSLQESIADRVLALEDIGWKKLFGSTDNDNEGLTLDQLKSVIPQLRELAGSNPWHVRGAQLRHSYIFGRGMNYVDVKPRTQKVLDDLHNQKVLFSVDAYDSMNMACFTDAAFIVQRNERTNRFTQIPMLQITGVVTNPDDAMDIWYIKRSWNSNGTEMERWLPVAGYKRSNTIRKTIRGADGATPIPVDQVSAVYIKHTKRQTGWTWGVPDSLAALVWTMAYSGYLEDNSKLVHALSKFAWSITKGTNNGIDKAAAQVVLPGIGGTAVGSSEGSLASVGVPSAQVNMNNGQPLIAAVATSFGVPTIALLSSPGATGGSYGAATTLDTPTLKGFEALQDSWTLFFQEIITDLGSPKARTEFPSIENDAPYRQITALVSAVELGVIWRDEARDAMLDILDVTKLHEELPELPDYPDKSGTLVSGQGVSGAGVNGATTNPGGDTDHSSDSE